MRTPKRWINLRSTVLIIYCSRFHKHDETRLDIIFFNTWNSVKFEAFAPVTMKNVFCDVTPCDSCKNRRFEGKFRLYHHCDKSQKLETMLVVTSNCSTFLLNLSTLSYIIMRTSYICTFRQTSAAKQRPVEYISTITHKEDNKDTATRSFLSPRGRHIPFDASVLV
jgi:hypothetical protein